MAGDFAILDLCCCSLASYPGDGTTVGGAPRAGIVSPIAPAIATKAHLAKAAMLPGMALIRASSGQTRYAVKCAAIAAFSSAACRAL